MGVLGQDTRAVDEFRWPVVSCHLAVMTSSEAARFLDRLVRLQNSQIALLGPFLFQGPVAALALRIT